MPQIASPRRKLRAGFIVAGLVLFIVITLFVGLNLEHAKEMLDEEASPASGQTE